MTDLIGAGRSPRRLLAYVFILGAALAYPALVAHTHGLRQQAFEVQSQVRRIEQARSDLVSLRERLQQVQRLSAETESLLTSAGTELATALPFSRRQVAVTQQALSRSQAEAWLRGFEASAQGFLVIDAFSIKPAGGAEDLFAASIDPDLAAQLTVSLKGEYIGRDTP